MNIYSQDFLKHRSNFQLVNWKFYKGDIVSAESGEEISKERWENVTVPHTYNAKDVLTEGEYYYQGIAWYRSSFELPKNDKNTRYFIRFEGVSLVADVFINGTYLGKHKGGYSAFCFEITPYIKIGKTNKISVRVDNSMQMDVAPSGSHLYPLFGGIYRPVTIFSTDDVCISPLDYASSGVYIHPVNVSVKKATLEIVTLLDYKSVLPLSKQIKALAKTTILDEKGNVVANGKENVILKNRQKTESKIKMHVDEPHLWDAKRDPYLYTLNVCIEDLHGKKLDEVEQPLGLRFFKVNKAQGLILNGKPYHLYGVSRHQEWEGLGPALTDKNHEKDVKLIMEIGANGVRLAHYQQADTMYSLCDRNGLVVWAEIPNTPVYRGDVPEYLQNCKEQLTELIKQNYNHPSILFWGMYNEIPISAKDVKVLHDTAKKLDPYRLTTQADFTQPNDRHSVTDVAAWNWYYGWYYGQFGEYAKWYNELHKEHPDIKGGLSEYGAGGCISQQQENHEQPDADKGRFFPEQYQRFFHEKVWLEIKNRQDIWCKFIWNLCDFSWTNVKRGDRDFINHKGLVTHDRKTKKDAFYFYKANWSDEPVLYILSRRNTKRKENNVQVAVYTNLDEVELYINEKLISKKKMESDIHKIVWNNVKLLPGSNQIGVIGYKDKTKYTDACQWAYFSSK